MDYTRRDLGLLIPALAVSQAPAQSRVQTSMALRLQDMPVRTSSHMRSRAILKGETHTAFPVDVHQSELDAGQAPHPPHRHVHEEILMLRSGMLDVTIGGKTTRLGPGSVAYIASNDEHGWRNTGASVAEYFVIALGEDKV